MYKNNSIAYEDVVAVSLSDELTSKDINEYKREASNNLYMDTTDGNRGRSLQKESVSRSR